MALVNGSGLRDIAGRFNLSKSAVDRHKADHLPQTMIKAQEVEDVRQAIDVVKQLKAINGVCLSILKAAHAEKDHETTFKAVDRVHRQIELQARLLGELNEGTTVNVLISPQWLSIRTVILTALAPYPEARIAVASKLSMLEVA